MKSSHSVVLIHTPCYELEDDRLEPPLGLLYLATWLKTHKHEVTIVDLSSIPQSSWRTLIPQADIYGFSTYTTTYHRTLEVLKLVRTINEQAIVVAGGPHASALPEDVAKDFDYVVVGEGENAILQLVRALDAGDVLPSVLKAPIIADLDTLPFPDYSLVDIDSYHRVVGGKPSLSILSSRGCPYRCVFCNSIIMGSHHHIRFRSAEHVVREIHQHRVDLGISSFRFQDDLFTANVPRLRKMAFLLRDEPIAYRCFGRVNLCTDEVAALLHDSGCQHIAFGVESGSPLILERMQKGQTPDDIRRGVAAAKAVGMCVRVYLMVGFPGETWETVQQTVDLMNECKPDEFAVYPLIPYPGTPLYQTPEKFGIKAINPAFSEYFQVRRHRGTGFVFKTDTLDEGLIAEMREYVITSLEPMMTWAGNSKGFR